ARRFGNFPILPAPTTEDQTPRTTYRRRGTHRPGTWWRGQDSNLRTRTRADLQSAAFNHSATPPLRFGTALITLHHPRRCGSAKYGETDWLVNVKTLPLGRKYPGLLLGLH